jgi:hypothetical protein
MKIQLTKIRLTNIDTTSLFIAIDREIKEYEPGSSKFRFRANAETSHSVRYDLVVVVVSIVGGGENFHMGW